jgi:hypothetical protein
MQCPPEVAEIVCEILRTGLLRIRALGWDRNPGRCAIEADHLHNLPALIASFDPQRLEYYWDAERVAFIKQSRPEDIAAFEPLWQGLAKHVTPPESHAIAG